ncbi:MAG: 1-acyl-sn-glycerol-3-phosphate acyltransferase [Geobacteraceae bacterium]|nr:1-acyl-sn-glycerol-3-phosphate acyltransferase [Geobacteraceae bacterium]
MLNFFFNFYFYLLFILAVLVLIPLFTLYVALTRTFSNHRSTMRRFRRAMVWWGKTVAFIPYPFIRFRYELNGENDTKKSYIFICNHRSAVDAFLMKVLPHEFVEIVNDWPFKIPVLGIFARFAAFLDIRSMSHEAFMAKATELLGQGVSIVFFPEGTRSVDGRMGSFHSAAFRLAVETGTPLVPLCITGNEIVMPKGSLFIKPGIIKIRQLPPLAADDFTGLTPFTLKSRVWKIMEQELSAMESTL